MFVEFCVSFKYWTQPNWYTDDLTCTVGHKGDVIGKPTLNSISSYWISIDRYTLCHKLSSLPCLFVCFVWLSSRCTLQQWLQSFTIIVISSFSRWQSSFSRCVTYCIWPRCCHGVASFCPSRRHHRKRRQHQPQVKDEMFRTEPST